MVEVPKVEVPKVEMPKVEMPKVEVPKEEVPKVEVPKVEMPKVEVRKEEVPKEEVPKEERNFDGAQWVPYGRRGDTLILTIVEYEGETVHMQMDDAEDYDSDSHLHWLGFEDQEAAQAYRRKLEEDATDVVEIIAPDNKADVVEDGVA
jgi:hypothetical protein